MFKQPVGGREELALHGWASIKVLPVIDGKETMLIMHRKKLEEPWVIPLSQVKEVELEYATIPSARRTGLIIMGSCAFPTALGLFMLTQSTPGGEGDAELHAFGGVVTTVGLFGMTVGGIFLLSSIWEPVAELREAGEAPPRPKAEAGWFLGPRGMGLSF